MWSSKRRLRAPVFADHALRAIVIVGALGVIGRPGLAMIVARAFSRRPAPELRLGAVPRKRRASSLDVARAFTSGPRSGGPGRAIIPSSENLQKIFKQIQHQIQLRLKPLIASAAKDPPNAPGPLPAARWRFQCRTSLVSSPRRWPRSP